MRVPAASLITALFSILVSILLSIPALSAQQTGGSIDLRPGDPLPGDLPAGARALLRAKGDGVQIYTCTDMHNRFKWVLKAPDAKLLDASGTQIGTHFAGPTWRLADGSQVQGELIASRPAPDANSVAWLFLRAKAGTATGSLADVRFIRRTETHGGVPPASGCQDSRDAGKTARTPYTALYTFYTER